MAEISNGYHIKETPIQYNKVVQSDHYINDAVFIYVKLFEVISLQYSQTGIVYFSNAELQEKLGGVSERGLQMAMVQLEKQGIMWRVFKDEETKRHRIGFDVDVDKVYELLSKKRKDVAGMVRGTIEKHIVMQKTIHIKPFARKLRETYKKMKKAKDKAKYKAIIDELLAKKREYELDIAESAKRATRAMEKARNRRYSKEDVFAGIKALVIGAGYKPPETIIN